MKNRLLMPARFKRFGWIIFLTTTIAFIGFVNFEWQPPLLDYRYKDGLGLTQTNLLKEIIFTSWVIGLVMIAFSRQREEDEYINYLRLASWQYSIVISLIVSVIGTWSIYGMNYLTFSALNMLTAPLAFLIIFNIAITRTLKRNNKDEE